MQKKIFDIEAKCLKLIVNFFIGYSFDELNEWLSKNKYDELDEELREGVGIFFNQSKNNLRLYGISIHEFSLNRKSLCILIHELHHLVDAQCKYKGIDDGEVKAYLIEYYFNEFLNK